MQRKIHIVILITLAVISYIPSFQGVWQYDDFSQIVENESLKNGVFNTKFLKGSNKFRAIPSISFAMNYSFGEHNIFGYHIVNLLIHMLVALFIYFFILELFFTIKQSNGIDFNSERISKIAFLTSLFWVIAPINVQAVTYIVQRMTSMTGLFYICSLFFYLKFRNNKYKQKKINYKLLFAFIISILFAFLSKQNSFLLIPTLFYVEWSFYRNASMKKVKLYSILGVALLLFSLLIVYLFFSSGTDSNILAILKNNYTNREFSPLQRLFIEPKILIHYISLMLFSFVGRFHLLYSFDWNNAPYQILPYLTSAIVAGAYLFSVKYVSKYKLLTFAIFFFLTNHLIESSVIGIQLVAEHRNYIPSVGIFLIMAVGIDKLQFILRRDKILKVVVVIFVIFSIFNTYFLNLKYKEGYCNAIYDYKQEYNGLNNEIVSIAVDKLINDKDYKNAFTILSSDYSIIMSNTSRKKFFDNYVSFSTRLLRYYIFLYYINSGFNIDRTISFIEDKFINDSDKFWYKVEMEKNYDNIFAYFYIKSLLFKYRVIDNTTYQKSLLFNKDVFDKYFFLPAKNYEKFVNYNQNDIKKIENIKLAENEKNVLAKINE